MNRITRALGAALLVLTLGAATPAADARANPPAASKARCKVIAVDTLTQTRAVSGVIVGYKDGEPLYGRGTQTRTVTTTMKRCRGQVLRSVVVSPWSKVRLSGSTYR